MAPRALRPVATVATLAVLVLGGCANWGRGKLNTVGLNRVTLFDFDDPAQVEAWRPVDDTATGGQSRSRLVYASPGMAQFAGNVSPKDGGGFASVRADMPDNAPRDFNGFILHVRGDGKRYIFYVTTGGEDEGCIYQLPFEASRDKWRDVLVPVIEFTPSCPGQRRRAGRCPSSADITDIGVMIAEPYDGPFTLEIDYIEIYSVPSGW